MVDEGKGESKGERLMGTFMISEVTKKEECVHRMMAKQGVVLFENKNLSRVKTLPHCFFSPNPIAADTTYSGVFFLKNNNPFSIHYLPENKFLSYGRSNLKLDAGSDPVALFHLLNGFLGLLGQLIHR